MSNSEKLTAKQQAFVEQYLVSLNASDAALRAGYSKKTAPYIGAENLKKPLIKAAITEAKQNRSERVQVDADYVLKRLFEIDQLDVADILDVDHSLKSVREWPKAWRLSISAIDIKQLEGPGPGIEAILKKIKWPDKLRNLELIGKHVDVKAFEEQINVKVDHAEILDAARKRAAKAKK
jgi:phage terminase small subunit